MNLKDSISNHVKNDEKNKLYNIITNIKINKHPHSIYINKKGLYSLVSESRLPLAKKLKHAMMNMIKNNI